MQKCGAKFQTIPIYMPRNTQNAYLFYLISKNRMGAYQGVIHRALLCSGRKRSEHLEGTLKPDLTESGSSFSSCVLFGWLFTFPGFLAPHK